MGTRPPDTRVTPAEDDSPLLSEWVAKLLADQGIDADPGDDAALEILGVLATAVQPNPGTRVRHDLD